MEEQELTVLKEDSSGGSPSKLSAEVLFGPFAVLLNRTRSPCNIHDSSLPQHGTTAAFESVRSATLARRRTARAPRGSRVAS